MKKLSLGVGAMVLTLMLGPPGKLMAGTDSMQFNGATYVLGSYYVAPYQVSVNGTVENLVCDDAMDDVYVGEKWSATTETLSNLSGALFSQGYLDNSSTNTISQAQAYGEAAWLVNQIYSNQGTLSGGELQYALWDVFDPGFSNTTGTLGNGEPGADLTFAQQQAVLTYLQDAQSNYGSGDYSNLMIYTPSPIQKGQAQEYFGIDSLQNMPEPMTLWSLFLALAAIGLACKWMDKTSVESPASVRI
ncbi:MAG: hypothetical protein ACRD3T_05750 [Terriglobia bacterium]